MELNIKILDVEVSTQPTKKDPSKTYQKLVVSYRNLDKGTTESQTLVEFANKPLFAEVSRLNSGDQMSVVKEKEGEYWQWKSIGAIGDPKPAPSADVASAPIPATTTVATTSDKKLTNEEYLARDDAKQLMIVRQSCLSTVAAVSKVGTSTEALIAQAHVLVNFVYNGVSEATESFDSMTDPLEQEFDEEQVI